MRIAFLVHGFPPNEIGGVEVYAKALVSQLRQLGLDCVVLAGSGTRAPTANLSTSFEDGIQVTRLLSPRRRPYNRAIEGDPEADALIRAFLLQTRPDVVHVLHWLQLSPSLVGISTELGIPAVVTLSDQWAACPRIHRVRPNLHACEALYSERLCLYCVDRDPWQSDGEITRSLALRYRLIHKELALAARLLVSTESSAEFFTKISGVPRKRLQVIPLGWPHETLLAPLPFPDLHQGPLKVGHWGNLNPLKGCHLLLFAAKLLPKTVPLAIHFWGEPANPAYGEYLSALAEGLNVTFHGKYAPPDLQRAELDLAVFPSLAHETYSFVLDEALALGLPVVVPARGALAERAGPKGILFLNGSIGDLSRALKEVALSPETLRALQRAPALPIAGLAPHACCLAEIYRSVREVKEAEPVRHPDELGRIMFMQEQVDERDRRLEALLQSEAELQGQNARLAKELHGPGAEDPLFELLKVYYARRDLRSAFPEVLSGEYSRLLEWARSAVTSRSDRDHLHLARFDSWYRSNPMHKLTQMVIDLTAQLHERDERLGTAERAVADFTVRFRERDERVATAERAVADLTTQLRERDERLAATEKALQAQLDALRTSLSWRATRPLRVLRAFQLRLARGWRTHRYELVPGPSVEVGSRPGSWRSLGDDPWFLLNGPMCGGWVELTYKTDVDVLERAALYVDSGADFSEGQQILLPRADRGRVRALVCLPPRVVRLRLDPCKREGIFGLSEVTLRPLTKWHAAARALGAAVNVIRRRPRALRHAHAAWRRTGVRGVKEWLLTCLRDAPFILDGEGYGAWVARHDTLTEDDRRGIRDHIETLGYTPLISVIMPVYNTDERWLRAAIESIRRQIYSHWELCIADDASSHPTVRRVLEEYRRLDDRIRVVYRETRGHISAASNSALELVTGEFLALLDHDDELSELALYMVVVELNKHSQAVLIYSDEDKIGEDGSRYDPYFKSDWNPDLFYGQNMISHLGAYRSSIVREIGGFRAGFEGGQDYELALRVIERISPDRIRHIPYVLYHWRAVRGSAALAQTEKKYAIDAARRALQSYFDRNSIAARAVAAASPVWNRALFALPGNAPVVSVIVPTHNAARLLRRCVASVRGQAYQSVELIIVDHRSDDSETVAYLRELSRNNTRIISFDGPFNYSAINNLAASQATGDVLLFLNNDVESSDPQWLTELLRHAVRQEVGAVGAALYYPDDTLQHGGVILGVGGVAAHAHLRLPRGAPGYMGRALLVQDVSAVTAACMAMRREVFVAAGGFDAENLPIAFNDVDLCLSIREKGYRIVWTPYAQLYHHESVSRGYDNTPETQARFARECAYMRRRWRTLLDCDPYYNPNLSLEPPAFQLGWPPRVIKPWVVKPRAAEFAPSGQV